MIALQFLVLQLIKEVYIFVLGLFTLLYIYTDKQIFTLAKQFTGL